MIIVFTFCRHLARSFGAFINEPAFLPFVLQTVSDCLGKPAAEVAVVTTQTARQFFRLQ
jgi:Tat protein secretion system quality control protein TatD with DNase activity